MRRAVESVGANLWVTPLAVAPEIVVQPESQAVGAGATVTFSVVATGTTPSYQWQFNGEAIPGRRNPAIRERMCRRGIRGNIRCRWRTRRGAY